jgi:hypothetical protein
VTRWNSQVVAGTDLALERMGIILGDLTGRSAAFVQRVDGSLFGEAVYGRVRGYSLALSALLRRLHSGNSRAYLFAGFLAAVLGGILFLLEGQ